jgi:hypothetical protein
VAHPTVTGPVTGGEHDAPFNAMPGDIGERYGYVEEEYFLAGEATAYAPDGDQGDDGHGAVTPAGTAPYATRVLVRRPADAAVDDGFLRRAEADDIIAAAEDAPSPTDPATSPRGRAGSSWAGASP